jgi:FixJ family two-component response regulator
MTTWRLPDGSGLDFAGDLARRCPNTAVVLLTSSGDIPAAEVAANIDGYLLKPFNKNAVLISVAASLRARHRTRALGGAA